MQDSDRSYLIKGAEIAPLLCVAVGIMKLNTSFTGKAYIFAWVRFPLNRKVSSSEVEHRSLKPSQ